MRGDMQRMPLVAALLATVVAVPVALAASPPTTAGQPGGSDCTRKVAVLLIGTLTSDPAFAGAGTFTMRTTAANKNGQNFVGGADETITVGAKTRIGRLGGPNVLAAFDLGERVYVHLRVCKADVPLSEAKLRATPASSVFNAATAGG
jgi:hypothetical protein